MQKPMIQTYIDIRNGYLDVSVMSAYLSSGVNNATISLNGTNKVGPCLLAAIQWMIVNVCGKSTVFPSTCQPKKKIILEKKLKKSLKKNQRSRIRGATGAARAPKPGKAPIMAARRRCCRRLLFFKIEVRPRPCRPYRVRRR